MGKMNAITRLASDIHHICHSAYVILNLLGSVILLHNVLRSSVGMMHLFHAEVPGKQHRL